MLVDESGFVLTLNNFEKATEVEYPGAFHIGFMQESRERVDEIHQQLKAGGFDMEPPKEFHGAWTFYFRARVVSSSRWGTSTRHSHHKERRSKARPASLSGTPMYLSGNIPIDRHLTRGHIGCGRPYHAVSEHDFMAEPCMS